MCPWINILSSLKTKQTNVIMLIIVIKIKKIVIITGTTVISYFTEDPEDYQYIHFS